MATLDELGAYLVTNTAITGIGPGTAPRLFYGRLPNTPDYCLALIATGGAPPEGGYGSAGIKFEHPTFQVVARGVKDDEQTPMTLAISAWTQLAEINAEALSGTTYLLVQPLQSPGTVLGPDEDGRPRVSFNIMISKELS